MVIPDTVRGPVSFESCFMFALLTLAYVGLLKPLLVNSKSIDSYCQDRNSAKLVVNWQAIIAKMDINFSELDRFQGNPINTSLIETVCMY